MGHPPFRWGAPSEEMIGCPAWPSGRNYPPPPATPDEAMRALLKVDRKDVAKLDAEAGEEEEEEEEEAGEVTWAGKYPTTVARRADARG